MADTYVINTVFKAHDQMASKVNGLTNRMDLFGRRSENSFKRASAGALKFKTILGGVLGANLITAGMARLRQGVAGLTSEFLDFDHAITSAASKFKFDRGTRQFNELAKASREVAAITPYSAAESAQALDYLAMAGFTAQQSMSSLKGVTDLAVAGNMDLAQASDIASDALGALNLMSTDSVQLAKNLDRVNDVMAQVAVTANTDIPMLWEALKPVASTAEGLGGTIEQLGAMFGTLASSGVKAEVAGTALRNMYLRLTSGTSEVEKVLKKYNVSIQDSKGKMRPMIDILDDVRKKTEKLDDKTRQAAYSHLFGARAVNSASILMKAGRDTVLEYQKRLEGASGAAADLARRMGESVPNKLKIMRSRLIEIGFQMIDMFADKIPGALDSMQEALDNINPAEVVSDLKEMWDIIDKNKRLIEAIGIAIISYNVAVKGATAVQWAFNAAMTANPVGLLIASITTLTAVTVIWAKNWDSMIATVKRDFEDLNWAIEDFRRDHPIISSWLGLSSIQPRSKAEIQALRDARDEAEITKQVGKTGYILGGVSVPKTEKELQRAITKKLDALSKIGEMKVEKIKETTVEKTQIKKQEFTLPNIKLGATPSVQPTAQPQKVQISGEFNFKNPPQGMTYTQSTKGAPDIKHNLGKNQ